MINVRALANSVTGSVNPNTLVTIRVSKGYTIGAGRKQIPAYEDTQGYAQVQALDHGDLMKIENLNLQFWSSVYCLKSSIYDYNPVDSWYFPASLYCPGAE